MIINLPYYWWYRDATFLFILYSQCFTVLYEDEMKVHLFQRIKKQIRKHLCQSIIIILIISSVMRDIQCHIYKSISVSDHETFEGTSRGLVEMEIINKFILFQFIQIHEQEGSSKFLDKNVTHGI